MKEKNKKVYKKYNKFDVVYADFGSNSHGVESGIRPGIIISCDASNSRCSTGIGCAFE